MQQPFFLISPALLFLIDSFYQRFLLVHRFNNDLCHIVDHLIGHAGVHADPEGVVHDKVSVGQLPCHAVGVGAADLVKAGVLDQVAAEQQAGLDIVVLNIAGHGVAVQAGFRLDRNQEAEPGRAAVGGRFRQDQLIGGRFQGCAQAVPVMAAAFDKAGELFSCSQPMAACISVTFRL